MRDTVVGTEVIRNAVQLACRAPSLHNSQPWRWILEGDVVELFVDPDRVLIHTDETGRETLIGTDGVRLDVVPDAELVDWTTDFEMSALATCTLTHITEIPASRQILSTLIGQTATPQVLVRVGRVPSIENPVPPTPRQPICGVFEVRQEPT